MPASTPLAQRIDRDLRLTRALLERLPDEAMSWRPHPRSFTLAGLGTHLARLPHWGAQILTRAFHDLAAGAGSRREPMTTPEEILALFDRHVIEWHTALEASDAAALDAPWQLRRGTEVLESMSHAEAVDRFLLHHLIHHRGQLTVYLRQLDVPLLPLYGPTADQQP
jgi:uncharacterized damage-inducible protein DinB